MKKVLDKGYVRLVETMGSDLTIVNAARVSYDKQSHELNDKDRGLIRFLIREGHTSPLRHAMMTFEIYAPLMVCRQHWKYVAGSSFQEATGDNMTAWNESSRRYISEDEQFYIPQADQWRSKPENSKQGSGKAVSSQIGSGLTQTLLDFVEVGIEAYEDALSKGIAPEQARLFLPAYGMYVRYYWTASLQSVLHFLDQRLEKDAQKEIQLYARTVNEYVMAEFPEVYKSWRDR